MKIIKTVMAVMGFATIINTHAFADQPGNNSPASQDATAPGDLDLIGGVNQLADAIVELDAAGQISHGRAQSLLNKLAKAQQALETPQAGAAAAGEVAAQQSVIGDLGKALKALTDFLRELTQLITELPADVVQPIINAVLDLINGIIGLLGA
ncbi:MAG TPA: hypothetical protein VKM56_02440 [Verrucomicrobiae bacterium]|nr:hypothetical protein [Verrucomicrobiae bacterium]